MNEDCKQGTICLAMMGVFRLLMAGCYEKIIQKLTYGKTGDVLRVAEHCVREELPCPEDAVSDLTEQEKAYLFPPWSALTISSPLAWMPFRYSIRTRC